MNARPLVVLLLLVAAPLAASTVSASHVACTSRDPYPPAPVGGVAGQVYTFTTGTAYAAQVLAVSVACGGANLGIHAVNSVCTFLFGRPCFP